MAILIPLKLFPIPGYSLIHLVRKWHSLFGLFEEGASSVAAILKLANLTMCMSTEHVHGYNRVCVCVIWMYKPLLLQPMHFCTQSGQTC